MKVLYIECNMGAAGDMLASALSELLPDQAAFEKKLNEIGIPGVEFKFSESVKCGITGTHIDVSVNGEHEGEEHHHHHHHDHDEHHEHHHSHEHHEHTHHHSSLHDIEHIVKHLGVSDKVKSDVMAVYTLIAQAESHVHGKPVTEIHFHEVGTMDAVADITAVCMMMEEIGADKIVSSPIHVGSGHVHCAHGILPVPAPATAYILKDCPIYSGEVSGELCTPTGAALLKYFASDFGNMPTMKIKAVGYGMGKKDFDAANCVRVMLGETSESANEVTELLCTVDDMTAEDIGFAIQSLLDGGALDVFSVPVVMKKSRPGQVICVTCKNCDKEKMLSLIFKYTSTIGVRENITKRYSLRRELRTVSTEYGDIRQKISEGYGVVRAKYEYDDLAKAALENGVTLDEVRRAAERKK